MAHWYLDDDGLLALWGKIKERSLPVREITKSEYNALDEDEKNRDVIYLIVDDNSGSSSSGGPFTQNVYSIDEIQIGTWIDGRPLYRRVISVNLPSSSGTTTVTNVTPGFDICMISGFLYDTGNNIVQINSYNPVNSATAFAYYTKTNGAINMAVSVAGWYGRPCILILEYTKTGDPVGPLEGIKSIPTDSSVLVSGQEYI